jgi:hypothetical protein
MVSTDAAGLSVWVLGEVKQIRWLPATPSRSQRGLVQITGIKWTSADGLPFGVPCGNTLADEIWVVFPHEEGALWLDIFGNPCQWSAKSVSMAFEL